MEKRNSNFKFQILIPKIFGSEFIILVIFLLFINNQKIFAQDIQIDKADKVNQDGYNTFYYENGKISSEGNMREGKPDGYWKTYYENGFLKSEGNRKNFELDSIWKFYNDDGELILEINYKNSKKNGLKRTFQLTGIIEEQFDDDIKKGNTIYYFPDGKIYKIVPYIDGKAEGISKEFSIDSVIIALVEYKKGYVIDREIVNRKDVNGFRDGKWILFYENGNIKFEGNYRNGKKDGYFKEYSEDGNLLKIEKYINDELQNEPEELTKLEIKRDYYPDGKIKIEGSYKDGLPEGTRRYYSESGEVTETRIYKKGVIIGEGITDIKNMKQGQWKEYYITRQLKTEGSYKNDEKIGNWKFYHQNGVLEQEGTYKERQRQDGYWRWYYESGNLRREEEFKDGIPNGILKEYNDSGKVLEQGKYIDGLEEGFWYYEIGDNIQEGSYIAGKREGIWKYYYIFPDNKHKLSFEGKFIDDNPDGKHIYYWDNGFKKEEGNYVMGKKEGEWRIYNYDGTVFLSILYKNGIEIKYNGKKIKPPFEEVER